MLAAITASAILQNQHRVRSPHLDKAEADPLLGPVGVERHIRLRLHRRLILVDGLLMPGLCGRGRSGGVIGGGTARR